MPFDIPFDGEFGDIQILMDARGRISGKGDWVKGRFREGDRHCLVDALSLAAGSPEISLPNRTEKQLSRLLAKQLPSRKGFWNRLVARCLHDGVSSGSTIILIRGMRT